MIETENLDIDLTDLVCFDSANGRVFLKNYRMVLFSCASLGALRKELIETLGWQQTRALLKRFGFAAGLLDNAALVE